VVPRGMRCESSVVRLGGLVEWFIALVLKTRVLRDRGFKSLILRYDLYGMRQ
jgi:hypothetical protein